MPLTGADTDPATKADVRRLYERLDKISDDLHDHFVKESDLALVRQSVQRLEDWQTWFVRIVLAAVIVAVMALVLTANPS